MGPQKTDVIVASNESTPTTTMGTDNGIHPRRESKICICIRVVLLKIFSNSGFFYSPMKSTCVR